MQTLYGIKITDRVTIEDHLANPYDRRFVAKFDGKEVAAAHSAPVAARRAQAWLQERAAERQAQTRASKEAAANLAYANDNAFLDQLADRIGCDVYDLLELIEIIKRRQ